MFPGQYTLYGSARSYFTSKVENVLRFQKLPYALVEKMIHDGSDIELRTGSGAIPALVTPEDWPLSDSTPIARLQRIRTFRQRMTTEVALAYGTTPEQGRDVMAWYGEFLDDMAAHLECHPFLLGERPTVADFVISGGFAAHFGNDLYPRNFVLDRQPAVLAYAEYCWNTEYSDSAWLSDDQVPQTWQPFFEAMQKNFLRYLMANRTALDTGADTVDVDFGFGVVSTPPRPYQELSRLDIRDEILRLPADDLARVRRVIPEGVLNVYLQPPLDQLPGVAGNKDTFPDPRGVGVLDDVS